MTCKGESLVPILVYPYYPLHLSIKQLALKPGFLSTCEQWRIREATIPVDVYGDIYDGAVWKSFRTDFLCSPYSYLLTLNLDWFQLYKHTEYSVGAIYLTIQNLPRHLRFKEENVILVGIIPGPKEPPLTVDPFILPLVQELKAFYTDGLSVLTPQGIPVTIRLALSCVACDIPASRKVCGFLSHNANLGCNKCYKRLSDNSSGLLYDRSN